MIDELMKFKGTLGIYFLIALVQVSSLDISSSEIAIGSNLTCFNAPVNGCVDLTNFEGTNATREFFMENCEVFLLHVKNESCNHSFHVSFYKVMSSNPNMVQFEHDIDVFGIYMYPSFYSLVNNYLRHPNPVTHLVNSTYYWLSLGIAAGMQKIDALRGEYTSLVWRSEPKTLNEYKVGETHLGLFWMSTSYNRKFAFNWANGKDNTFLMISNSRGRDINNIVKGEWQVLLSAGLNYHVMYQMNLTDGKTQVFMYEIDNVTIDYTPQDQSDLLEYMIKVDAAHAQNGTVLSPSEKKGIALHQIGRNLFSKAVPFEWTCDQDYFDMNDGCDCDCGAWDPDCDKDQKISIILNCDFGGSPTCDRSTSKCNYSEVPSEWTCEVHHYNSKDGCHCGCGAHDPDCDGNGKITPILTECRNHREKDNNKLKMGIPYSCGSDGSCIYADRVPESWFCDEKWYGVGDGCDCNCGAIDPDCEKSDLVMNCPCSTQTCESGKCSGKCEIIIN